MRSTGRWTPDFRLYKRPRWGHDHLDETKIQTKKNKLALVCVGTNEKLFFSTYVIFAYSREHDKDTSPVKAQSGSGGQRNMKRNKTQAVSDWRPAASRRNMDDRDYYELSRHPLAVRPNSRTKTARLKNPHGVLDVGGTAALDLPPRDLEPQELARLWIGRLVGVCLGHVRVDCRVSVLKASASEQGPSVCREKTTAKDRTIEATTCGPLVMLSVFAGQVSRRAYFCLSLCGQLRRSSTGTFRLNTLCTFLNATICGKSGHRRKINPTRRQNTGQPPRLHNGPASLRTATKRKNHMVHATPNTKTGYSIIVSMPFTPPKTIRRPRPRPRIRDFPAHKTAKAKPRAENKNNY